jgi:DamX protein
VETSAADHAEQQVEVPDAQLPSTTEGPTGVRDNSWVQTQLEDAFTVQLLAGQNLAAVEAVVTGKHLAPNAALIQFSKNGALWYAILYGSYPDRNAAASAVANFPSTLKSFKPWIRSFASIKKILQ